MDEADLMAEMYNNQYSTKSILAVFNKIREHEREECAKVCEKLGSNPKEGSAEGYEGDCAAAIRARSIQ